MTVKGLIKSIDYAGNTCIVRIPVFESASTDNEVCLTATFASTPGIYNSYKENDVVYVAFENNQIESPIVFGKLYLGTAEEQKDPRGAINCSTFTTNSSVSIPINTKLTLDNDPKKLTAVGVDGSLANYKSIADIARAIKKQEEQIGSINAQFIDGGDSLGARVTRLEEDDTRHEAELRLHNNLITLSVNEIWPNGTSNESQIAINADNIENKVVHIESGQVVNGLGWTLTPDEWTLTKYKNNVAKNILVANEEGLTVTGTIFADAGKIGGDSGWLIEPNKLTSGTDNKTITLTTVDDCVHYIEASGQQYIDTEYSFIPNTDSFEIVVESLDATTNGSCIFGATYQAYHFNTDFYLMLSTTQSTLSILIGGSETLTITTPITSGKHTFKFADKKYYIDDSLIRDLSSTFLAMSTITFPIGARRDTQTIGTGATAITSTFYTNRFIGKIYSCKIWQTSNNLVRDYTPFYKLEQDSYGLYDKVNNLFYSSASGTDFIGAPSQQEFNAIYLGADRSDEAPFKVTNTGKLFASEANITGTINANLGTIAGFTIDYNSIYNGDPEHWTSGDVIVSRGTDQVLPITGAPSNQDNWAFAAGTEFGVTASGNLYASAGTIGSFNIAEWGLCTNKTSWGSGIRTDGITYDTRYEAGNPRGYQQALVLNGLWVYSGGYGTESSPGIWFSKYNDIRQGNNLITRINENGLYFYTPINNPTTSSAPTLNAAILNQETYGNLSGTWTYNGNEIATVEDSDKNVKHDIESLPEEYTTLFDNLKPVRFKFNNGTSNRYHTGFIAQELEEAITKANLKTTDVAAFIHLAKPSPVAKAEYRIRYEELIALCVNEIQKLKIKVKDLEEKISELKNK